MNNATTKLIEEDIPKLREQLVDFITTRVSELSDNMEHSDVKKYCDLLVLIEKSSSCINENRSFTVDFTNDEDILIDEIFWTEERLNAIENYILPDLKEYVESSKKKVQSKKLRKLSTTKTKLLKD